MRKIAELLWQCMKNMNWMKKVLIKERGRMRLLYPGEQIEKIVDVYYVDTITLLLKILLVGSLLLLVVWGYEEYGDRAEIYSVERNEYGEGSKQIDLVATGQDGLTTVSRLRVEERLYTQEEIERLFEELVSSLENLIAGSNESLHWVETSLDLPSEIEGFPFLITWKSNNRTVISDAGEIQNVYREQEVAVSLEALFQYEDFEETFVWEVTVAPSLWTKQQIWEWTVDKSLQSAESESVYQKEWGLPNQINGEDVTWKVENGDAHTEIVILFMLCIVFLLWGRDFELKRRLKQRKDGLEEEYNGVITRLVLYLGTGLPIKKAWNKTALVLESLHPDSIVAQEMILTSREMDSGFFEKDCYISFGKRCGRQEYMRLGTLLSQNLKKGNSELLKRLREEAKMSGEQQKHIVRKRGEEATTKLLAPMMMLLAITMVLIMFPAFMGIN